MNNDLNQLLLEETQQLEGALKIFEYSFTICSEIDLLSDLSMSELTEFEALTARFSRLSDLLIQKVFRSLDEFELLEPGSIRDRINRSEKRGITSNSDDLIRIRTLRNEIAHEYLPEILRDLFSEVFKYSRILLEICNNTLKYCRKILT